MMAFYTATSLLLVMLVIANWSILLDAKVNRTWEKTQFLESLSKRAGPDTEPVIVPRIIGGVDAKIKAWPWMVVIETDGVIDCGGVLIAQNLVLTAAHCVKELNLNDIILRVGVLKLNIRNVNEQRFRVEDIIVHNGHSSRTHDNDIALIQLKGVAKLNDYVATIPLPAQNYVVPLDASCFATGWGWTRPGGPEHDILQQVKLPIVDKKKCAQAYTYAQKKSITKNMLCAGKWKGIAICKGDSGGPLVCEDQRASGSYVLQGLMSWNRPMVVKGKIYCGGYSVFTRVSKYRDWIDQSKGKMLDKTLSELLGTFSTVQNVIAIVNALLP